MRAFVTGGAGFIGSHLVDRLIADGHRVAVLDDLSTGHRDRIPRDAVRHIVDVVNAHEVTDVVTTYRPDVIYHLAAQISVRYSVVDPVADATTNTLGTVNLLNAATAIGAQLILASTGGAMYGDGVALPTPEDCLPATLAPYGISKYCAEQYLMLFNRLHAGRHIALRLGNVYGPRQDPHGEAGVVAIFCGQVACGETPTIYGDGKQTRDYIYVADVVDAFLAAADYAGDEAVFNIGTGNATAVGDLLTSSMLLQELLLSRSSHRPGQVSGGTVHLTPLRRRLSSTGLQVPASQPASDRPTSSSREGGDDTVRRTRAAGWPRRRSRAPRWSACPPDHGHIAALLTDA